MAIYRIKPPEDGSMPPEPKYPPEEYWRETDPAFARDLDFDEIEELNKEAEAEDGAGIPQEALDTERPLRPSWVKLMLTLLLAVAFCLWMGFTMIDRNINWQVLTGSAQLGQDESLAMLKEAVVTIDGGGSSGSGFNIAPDGLIVTNRHVVENNGILTIRFGDGQVFTTREWADIPEVDMAILDIEGNDLPYVELASGYPETGEPVIFIGNPLGFDWTISEGQVLGMVEIADVPLIYMDGPVYPGSSGSPVFNSESKVAGVIFARLTDEENKGLAIPIDYLTNYLEDIYEH